MSDGNASGAGAGVVHDLGYRPYEGDRLPQRDRFKVIARKLVRRSWTGWWRWKFWLGLAVVVTAVVGALLYAVLFLKNTPFGGGIEQQIGKIIPGAFGGLGNIAFAIALSSLAGVVAQDLRAGAFEFYFSKSIRPFDYALGKLTGGAVLIGAVLVGAPLIMGLTRISLASASEGAGEAVADLPLLLGCGVVATAAHVITPLAISSLARKPAFTIAAYAALYTIGSLFVAGIAALLDEPAILGTHLPFALKGLVRGAFDIAADDSTPPLWASAAGLAVYIVGGLLILSRQLRKADSSLGGGS